MRTHWLQVGTHITPWTAEILFTNVPTVHKPITTGIGLNMKIRINTFHWLELDFPLQNPYFSADSVSSQTNVRNTDISSYPKTNGQPGYWIDDQGSRSKKGV